MGKLVQILLSSAVLASPINSYAVPQPVFDNPMQMQDYQLTISTVEEVNNVFEQLDELVEVYNSNDEELIKKFGNDLLINTPEKIYFQKVLKNSENYLRDNAFFFLLNDLTFQVIHKTGKIPDEHQVKICEISEEKKFIYQNTLEKLIKFYDDNKELVEKEFFNKISNIRQKNSRFCLVLSKFLSSMPENFKYNAVEQVYQLFSNNLLSVKEPTSQNIEDYINTFENIYQQTSNLAMFSNNNVFFEKYIDFVLLKFDHLNSTVVPGDKPYINTMFKALNLINYSEISTKQVYDLLKNKLLSSTFRGMGLKSYAYRLPDATFIDFSNQFTDLFEKTFFLLNKLNLNEESESVELKNQIRQHLEINREYLDRFLNIKASDWTKTRDEIHAKTLINSYSLIYFLDDNSIKNELTQKISTNFKEFITNKVFNKSTNILQKTIEELFLNVKKTTGDQVLNDLAINLEDELLTNINLFRLREYNFFLSLSNTEHTLNKLTNSLMTNYEIEGTDYSSAELFSNNELFEYFSKFNFDLLSNKVNKLRKSQKFFERSGSDKLIFKNNHLTKLIELIMTDKIKNVNSIEELKSYVNACLNNNDLLFFNTQAINNWTDLGEDIINKTEQVLRTIYLPNKPFEYLDEVQKLPSANALTQIIELYGVGGTEQTKELSDQTYYQLMNTYGTAGYSIMVKNMIDSLVELETDLGESFILKIMLDHTNDEEIIEYAKKAIGF